MSARCLREARRRGAARSMLRHLTGRSSDEIYTALSAAGGSVQLAALLVKGCDLADAWRRRSAAPALAAIEGRTAVSGERS